jgi:hypothetical protein
VILFKVSLPLGIELASSMTHLVLTPVCQQLVLVQPVCQLNRSAMTATYRGKRRLQEPRVPVLAQRY